MHVFTPKNPKTLMGDYPKTPISNTPKQPIVPNILISLLSKIHLGFSLNYPKTYLDRKLYIDCLLWYFMNDSPKKQCKHTWKLKTVRSRFGINWKTQVCAKCGTYRYK